MRYGLLTYSTTNIGDEIQSVTARRFLPAVDVYIDRDSLDRTGESEPFKLILNNPSHREKLTPWRPELSARLPNVPAQKPRMPIVQTD
jgi:hypothetical protein